MKYRLYFFSSLIYVILGIGHLIAEFVSRIFLNPTDNSLYASMSLYDFKIFGFTRSIYEYMQGFSVTMGFLLFFFGGLNLLFLKFGREVALKVPAISAFNACVSCIIASLSVIYFHWPPILCYALSCLGYLLIFIKIRKES